MKKLKDLLNESVEIGKVYSNPYAKSFVKEEEEERQQAEELTTEQKQAFLEAVKGYKAYGESVYRKEGLTKVYESIRGLVEVANKVTLSETGDWFDGVTVGRHMKRMNESFKVFEKTLKEVSTLQQRLDETVSIKSFGAFGDGTDQTEIIQQIHIILGHIICKNVEIPYL